MRPDRYARTTKHLENKFEKPLFIYERRHSAGTPDKKHKHKRIGLQ